MASPVNDTYTITSGTNIYAGTFGEAVLGGVACTQSAVSSSAAIGSGTLSWVPAVGAVADVSTNTINDVAAGSRVDGIFSYTGMAYAESYGLYGSLIMTGGGHGDGVDNDIYRYDIATRTFSKIKNRATTYVAADSYIADQTTGWMWANAGATATQVGEPFAAHFYGHLLALPASALAGAPNGWLFTPGRGTMPLDANRGTRQSHKLALGMETQWTMHGTPLAYSIQYGPGIYDSLRNRVLHFRMGFVSDVPYIDIATGAVGTFALQAGGVYPEYDGYYRVGAYHAGADCYMLVRYMAGALNFRLIDAATRMVYTPATAGTVPTETDEGAWDWVEAWGAWVYYPALGGSNIYTLKSPANPRTGTWTWAKQTITGTVRSRPPVTHGPPFTRIRYIPSADCVLWVAKYNEPVQAIRISAP